MVIGVDRKSSDKTLKISKKYADVLFRFDWHNDFSEIRNKLIEKSSGEWILISDGHEIWYGIENIAEILLLAPSEVNAFAFMVRMNPDEGSSMGQQLRLFKNIPAIRYEGAVHNRLQESGESLATEKVWIYHDRKEKRRSERHTQRKEMTEKYFLNELEKNPNDARALYYLGTFYLGQSAEKDDTGRIVNPVEVQIDKVVLQKAIDYLERYISVSEFYEERYLAEWYLAQAYFHMGNLAKTKELGLLMVEQMLELPLGQEILAELYMYEFKEKKNPRALSLAELWFKLARSKKKPFVSCFFPEPFFTWVPWERLTELYSIAAQKQPERIIDAIISAEATLKFPDFPETRRIELQRVLDTWRALLEDTDNSGSGDRQFDNVHTIDTSNSGTLSNEGRSVRSKFDVAKLPEYIEKPKCQQPALRL